MRALSLMQSCEAYVALARLTAYCYAGYPFLLEADEAKGVKLFDNRRYPLRC